LLLTFSVSPPLLPRRHDVFSVEQEAHLPADILKCHAVSREINFSSVEEIAQFRLEQRIFLDQSCIEGKLPRLRRLLGFNLTLTGRSLLAEWIFTFGYVIPGSTNTWQQTIESAGQDNMLDPSDIR
jgi:retinal rod rhodopsin-sensitive cGMP 3',5'-cyclic phosphodiesterase subunit delta